MLLWPTDYLERVLGERERRTAAQRYHDLEEAGLAGGVEMGRTPHGKSPGQADYWTTPDGFYAKLEHYRKLGYGDPPAKAAPSPDLDMDDIFEAFRGG